MDIEKIRSIIESIEKTRQMPLSEYQKDQLAYHISKELAEQASPKGDNDYSVVNKPIVKERKPMSEEEFNESISKSESVSYKSSAPLKDILSEDRLTTPWILTNDDIFSGEVKRYLNKYFYIQYMDEVERDPVRWIMRIIKDKLASDCKSVDTSVVSKPTDKFLTGLYNNIFWEWCTSVWRSKDRFESIFWMVWERDMPSSIDRDTILDEAIEAISNYITNSPDNEKSLLLWLSTAMWVIGRLKTKPLLDKPLE